MLKKRGAVIVEAAIIIPLFFYMLFNIIYCAFMLYDRHVLGYIVQSNLRTAAASAGTNVTIKTNAQHGAGLVFHDETVFAEKIYNSVTNELILYGLTKSTDSSGKDVYNGITAVIKPHEEEESTTSSSSAGHTTTTVKDADIILTTTVDLKPDLVPSLMAPFCPDKITCTKQMRIELHINKVINF